MDRKYSPAFRTAINGFNRTDVNDYISRMSAEFDEKTAELEEKIKKLKSKLREAEELAESANSASKDKESDNKSEELERAECIIASQTEQLDMQKAEIDRLGAELSAANEKLASYSEIEEKMAEYEAMSAKMGNIFMGAAAEAEKIKTSAKEEADLLLLETDEKCRAKEAEIEGTLLAYAASQRAIIDELFDTTHKSITNVLDAYEKKAQSLVKESRKAFDEGAAKSEIKSAK